MKNLKDILNYFSKIGIRTDEDEAKEEVLRKTIEGWDEAALYKTIPECNEVGFIKYVKRCRDIDPRVYDLPPTSKIQFAVIVENEKDFDYYVKYLASELNNKEGYNCASYDYLKHEHGIFIVRDESHLIGLNLKAVLVSTKIVETLRGKRFRADLEKYRDDWRYLMNRAEIRMGARFRENYRIFMGTNEQAVWYEPGTSIILPEPSH